VLCMKSSKEIVLAAPALLEEELHDASPRDKIIRIDDHIFCAFAGLAADARVLANKARIMCQNYRWSVLKISSTSTPLNNTCFTGHNSVTLLRLLLSHGQSPKYSINTPLQGAQGLTAFSA
jgi:Proteasome subunit